MAENKQVESDNESNNESFDLRGNATEYNYEEKYGGEKTLKRVFIALAVIGALLLTEIVYYSYSAFISIFEDDTKTEAPANVKKQSDNSSVHNETNDEKSVVPKEQQLNPNATMTETNNGDYTFRTYTVTAPETIRTNKVVLSLEKIEKQDEDGYTIIESDEEYVYPTLNVRNVTDQAIQTDRKKWLMYNIENDDFVYQTDFDSYRYNNIAHNPVVEGKTNTNFKFMFVAKREASLAMCYNAANEAKTNIINIYCIKPKK